MKSLKTDARDLVLMLVASESWVEWQAIVGRVLQRTPAAWRRVWESELQKLKQGIGVLWNVFVKSYNASPGTIHDAVVIAEAVTEASQSLGLSFTMAPRYQWAEREMSCHLQCSVTKRFAKDRYRKPTQKQLEEGEACRGLEAAKGVLPVTGVVSKKWGN